MKRKNTILIIAAFSLFIFLGYSVNGMSGGPEETATGDNSKSEIATFAGGCFWCMEPPFEKLPGVQAVVSGYTGGDKKNPTYKEVSHGLTHHVEAIQIHFDPALVSYGDLLEVFWRNINPTDAGGQFVDRGNSYVTGIFVHNDQQKQIAETSRKKLSESGRYDKKIVTPITRAKEFYAAEEYHQDYYKKSPVRYKFYRYSSGRDDYLDKTWGKEREYQPMKISMENEGKKYQKPPVAEIKKRLSPLQYKVTQKNGTERPYDNAYWDNKKEGIYVDVVSGEPLFSSKDKFKSGTGWASFTRPLVQENIVILTDSSYGMRRTEVRSHNGDSHLGHLFKDGPQPTGLRYCINSASLFFIAREGLAKEGYGEFEGLFNNNA